MLQTLFEKYSEFLNTSDIAQLYSLNKSFNKKLKSLKAIKSSI